MDDKRVAFDYSLMFIEVFRSLVVYLKVNVIL